MSMSLLQTWWAMLKTDNELAGHPIAEETIILNFSGSGASCHLTKKQMDEALAEYYTLCSANTAAPSVTSDNKDAERYQHMQREEYQHYLSLCPSHGVDPLSFEEYKVKSDKISDEAIAASKSKERT